MGEVSARGPTPKCSSDDLRRVVLNAILSFGFLVLSKLSKGFIALLLIRKKKKT